MPFIDFATTTDIIMQKNVYGVLVGRPEVKRPLGRPRRRREDNIKIDLRDIGIDGWVAQR
jgi:hypothetical protein